MSDQNGPATPTGVPEIDPGNGATDEREDDRPAHRAEDDVDVDVRYDDIESDPVRDADDETPGGMGSPTASEE